MRIINNKKFSIGVRRNHLNLGLWYIWTKDKILGINLFKYSMYLKIK